MGKKKENLGETVPASTAQIVEGSTTEMKVKKKKKNKKSKGSEKQTSTVQEKVSDHADNSNSGSSAIMTNSHKKKKKRLDHGTLESEKIVVENNTEDLSDSENIAYKKPKKKKKHRKQRTDSEENESISLSDSIQSTSDLSTGRCSDKKIKRKHKELENEHSEETTNLKAQTFSGSAESESNKVKQKKKKKKDKVGKNVSGGNDASKSKTINVDQENLEANQELTKSDSSENLSKKFKKKRKYTKDNNDEDIGASIPKKGKFDVESSEEANIECGNKSRKKKKKSKKRIDPVEIDDSSQTCVRDTEKSVQKKKKKLNSMCSSENIKTNSDGGKSKEPTDIESSHPDMAASVTKAGFGQWGTADMGNVGRQQKFLRLLGGCKKQDNSKESIPVLKKFNMAMDKKEESKMNEALENQFDSARNIVMCGVKGGGFGYEAPPDKGKKFYIDSDKSKSVKFD